MKKNLLHIIILSAINLLYMQNARAQVSTLPFTASLDTFSEITGTTLDAMGADDVQYPNLDIGFSFSLGGTMHDKFTATTNGFIELDTISTTIYMLPLNGTHNNLIAPLGADLMHTNGNASLQYITLGTAPNRICIVQWLHYSYFGGNGDINFQIWLYESSNCIRFVYGANTFLSNPLQTQIGLRGTSDTDFNVLGDTVCNWASAYPFPALNTTFPVSLYCNMPSGFAFHFGACANNGGLNFAYITGNVFNDVNGNGTLDGGEPGIANHIVHITPGNYYVSSYLDGEYAFFFFDSTLTYSLTSAPQLYWIQTTPATLMVDPLSQPCSGNNIGFQMIPNVHEVSITTPNWGAKPGQAEPMPISFSNNGTVTESDTISFVMDSLYSFISSTPAPAYISGQTIKWAY
ncbi:MAG TPA: hypothetical protein VE978_18055, partial [Chitinophagales bacterium]|nr:hypothetical protein [Chitinophagales bacterium]